MSHDYSAVMHVHSNYSDGTGTVEEIIAAAKKTRVHIVFLTDHDTLQPALDGHAGWHDGVLVVVGTEISPNLNHYLAFGLDPPAAVKKLASLSPQEIIDTVSWLGGFGFIAHPDHTGTTLFDVPSYRWEDWSVKGFTGISVWDMMTDFEELLATPEAALAAFKNFPHSLTGPKQVSMARWDSLLTKGNIAAIGEVDNHAEKRVAFGQEVTVFPYELVFRTIRLHFPIEKSLTGEAEADTKTILSALKKAAFYIAFDFETDASGFMFQVCSEGKRVGMGAKVKWRDGAVAEFALAREAEVRLMLDGAVFWSGRRREGRVPLPRAGVLRFEARTGNRPWIISNPIWMRP
jgi:hypothetical protein